MRRTLTTLLVGLALLGLVAAAGAQQSETQMLRDTVKQLQNQLKTVMDRLQQLEAKQAAPAPAPKPSWTDKLAINGYLQPQYIWRTNARDDFQLRRMYLNIAAKVNERATGVIQVERVGSPYSPGGAEDPALTLSSCYVDYKFGDQYSFMLGQVPAFWGWDSAESSSKRLPLERFAATEGWGARDGRPGVRGFYWGGPWDRGFYLTRNAEDDREPTVILGLVNGNYRANDNDNDKAASIDLKWKRGRSQFGLSYLSGTYTDGTGLTTDRNGYDLFYHSDPSPWGFQAEFLDGEVLGHPIQGFYGQVAYNKGGKGTPFIRCEQYDQNEDARGDTFFGIHFGYAHQLDKNNELTFQITEAHVASVDMDYAGVQWQIGF